MTALDILDTANVTRTIANMPTKRTAIAMMNPDVLILPSSFFTFSFISSMFIISSVSVGAPGPTSAAAGAFCLLFLSAVFFLPLRSLFRKDFFLFFSAGFF